MTHPNETPEPPAQGQAGEMPTLPKALLNAIGEYGMARTDSVSEMTIQHRWLTLIAGIKEFTAQVLTARLSDATAALQAKDAEIARLKADAGRLTDVGLMLSNFAFNAAHRVGRVLSQDDCASLKFMYERWDAAMKGEAA